jgi:hypothetical protein
MGREILTDNRIISLDNPVIKGIYRSAIFLAYGQIFQESRIGEGPTSERLIEAAEDLAGYSLVGALAGGSLYELVTKNGLFKTEYNEKDHVRASFCGASLANLIEIVSQSYDRLKDNI